LPNRLGGVIVTIIASLLLVACTLGGDLPPLPEMPPHPYVLGPGDVVRLATFGDQQLTSEFRVGDSGTIDLPLLGGVQAAGVTVAELQKNIVDLMVTKHLFQNPSIAAEVVSYRPIFILGEVAKPGQYPYQPGMTVLTAVAVAGGFTYRAVQNYAGIVRVVEGTSIEGKGLRRTLVEPGDVITVFERRF
jgi:polysaccharide export outer membrane protein